MDIDLPLEGTKRIRFKLNAPNNYFSRLEQKGELSVTPSEMLETRQLTTGILSLDLQSLPNAQPGTTVPITVTVDRPGDTSLSATVRVRHVSPPEPDQQDSDTDEPIGPIPNVIEVNHNERENFGEFDVIELDDYTDEGEGVDVFINTQCRQLRDYINQNDLTDAEETKLEVFFKRSIVSNAVSQYMEFNNEGNTTIETESEEDGGERKSEFEKFGDEIDRTRVVAQGIRGLAWTIPHQFKTL
jgi:hypothetical protein